MNSSTNNDITFSDKGTDRKDNNNDLEQKIDLLLEQQQAMQKAIAHLRADISELIKASIESVLSQGVRVRKK